MPRKLTVDSLFPAVERFGSWVRGPARLSGSRIVMDFAHRVQYWPGSEPDLVPVLSRVRTADDAVRFVERFGLITQGPIFCDDEYIDGVPRERIPRQCSEPVAHLVSSGEQIHTIAVVLRNLRKALNDNDPVALKALQSWSDAAWKPHLRYGKKPRNRTNDLRFLRDVELWLAAQLSEGLKGVEIWVAGGASSNLDLGTFRFAIGEAKSLLHFCYFELSHWAIGREVIEQCESCGDFFLVHDRRQRFCGPTCATRERVKRFKLGRRRQASKR